MNAKKLEKKLLKAEALIEQVIAQTGLQGCYVVVMQGEDGAITFYTMGDQAAKYLVDQELSK